MSFWWSALLFITVVTCVITLGTIFDYAVRFIMFAANKDPYPKGLKVLAVFHISILICISIIFIGGISDLYPIVFE